VVADLARFAKGMYLWGMLEAHKIQERYLENNFQDDPQLTGSMVRAVLMHGQDATIKGRLNSVEEAVEAVTRACRNESTDKQTLNRRLKDIDAEIKNLQNSKQDKQ